MIVGNKSDLPNKYRKVSYEQASFFAHQNRCTFMEVSARRYSGIQESFDNLIKLHINSTNKRIPLVVTKREEKGNGTTAKNSKKLSIIGSKKDCVIM